MVRYTDLHVDHCKHHWGWDEFHQNKQKVYRMWILARNSKFPDILMTVHRIPGVANTPLSLTLGIPAARQAWNKDFELNSLSVRFSDHRCPLGLLGGFLNVHTEYLRGSQAYTNWLAGLQRTLVASVLRFAIFLHI